MSTTQIDAAVKLILDDIARKVATEVRRGATPGADSPAMTVVEGLAALYPTTYKQWEGK